MSGMDASPADALISRLHMLAQKWRAEAYAEELRAERASWDGQLSRAGPHSSRRFAEELEKELWFGK